MKNRNLTVSLACAAAMLILGGVSLNGCTAPEDPTQSVEVYTDPFVVVAEGELPPAPHKLHFPTFDQPRLLWITGLHAEMVNPDGSPAESVPAYRTDVGFNYMRHARIFELPVYHTDRLFTLTGRQADVTFPEGFGLPFYTDEVLTLTTRPIEPASTGSNTDLRQRVVLEFVLDLDLEQPMKPLFVTSGRWDRTREGGPEQILRLSYDTQAHYITAPLRPYAESVQLRDLSTGEIAYDSTHGTGAETTESAAYFSGLEGIELFTDRPYLLVSEPGRSDEVSTGSTAAMLLYLRDKLYKKRPRKRAPVAHFEEPIATSDERLILLTNHGKIEIALYPEVAPRHYKQILELARLGVYDGVEFHRVEPDFLIQLGFPEQRVGTPLSDEQKQAIRRLEAEFSDLPMKRWTVAMALHDNADPDSAEASFFMLLQETRRLDQQYTIIGRVISGLGTLGAIARLPLDGSAPIEPVFIEKAEVKTVAEITAGRVGRLKRSRSSKGQ